MCILSGDGSWQVRDIDIEGKGCQKRSLLDAFLRRRNLLLLPFPVMRVKLHLPTISMIMRTMCLSGSSLQVRPQCHTVSQAAARLTNIAPAFFLAEKLSSMSCVIRVTWSIVDLRCQKAHLLPREQWVNDWDSTSVDEFFKDFKVAHSRDMGR